MAMINVQLQTVRAYPTLCSVCGEKIQPEQEAWHEPARNWHAHVSERCGPRFDQWIGAIEFALKTKQPVREVMKTIPGATVAPLPSDIACNGSGQLPYDPCPGCKNCRGKKKVEKRPGKPVQMGLF